MTSTVSLVTTNDLITKRESILEIFNDPLSLLILNYINIKSIVSIKQISQEIGIEIDLIQEKIKILESLRLLKESEGIYSLIQPVIRRLNNATLDLESLIGEKLSNSKYITERSLHFDFEIIERIGKGATSHTFLSRNLTTHRFCTFKIFLPDIITLEELDSALCKRAKLKNPEFPDIIDQGEIEISLDYMKKIKLVVVVLEYINGDAITFAKYLDSKENFSSKIFESFIEKVGNALLAIEKNDLTHGDLHEGNILVKPSYDPSYVRDFFIIDFIGIPSYRSDNLEVVSDLDSFKNNLLKR